MKSVKQKIVYIAWFNLCEAQKLPKDDERNKQKGFTMLIVTFWRKAQGGFLDL